MKKIDEVKQRLEQLKAQAKTLLDTEGTTLEAIKDIKNKINIEQEKLETLEAMNKVPTVPTGSKLETGTEEEKEKQYKRAFFNMVRGKNTLANDEILTAKNQLSSSSGEDGGYLIPNDQQTAINELKKHTFAFREYVTVEPVSTSTGSRNREKSEEDEGFQDITNGGEIADVASPKFVNIPYSIKDYAGILPIPNNLKNDSDVNLERYINKWLARKTNATENREILKILNAISTPTPVKTVDDLKMAINTKINAVFKPTLKVYMNSDAFTHFSREKDTTGRYLLETDPKRATGKMIDGVPIIEVPNELLKTSGQKAKIFIGDMEEFITLFDRQAMTILSTQTGGDSFKTNTTGLRAITRFDVQKFDDRAMIACELDFSALEMVSELNESVDLNALITQLVGEELKRREQQASQAGQAQTSEEDKTTGTTEVQAVTEKTAGSKTK